MIESAVFFLILGAPGLFHLTPYSFLRKETLISYEYIHNQIRISKRFDPSKAPLQFKCYKYLLCYIHSTENSQVVKVHLPQPYDSRETCCTETYLLKPFLYGWSIRYKSVYKFHPRTEQLVFGKYHSTIIG